MLRSLDIYNCFVILKLLHEQLKRREKVSVAENLSAKQKNDFAKDDAELVEKTKRWFQIMYDNRPELFLDDLHGRGIIDANGLLLKLGQGLNARLVEIIIDVGKEMSKSKILTTVR